MNKDIRETTFGNLNEARINKSNKVLYGVHLMSRQKSKNGYTYSEKSMGQCAKLADGVKAFLNHSTTKERNERNGQRKIQDFLGTFYNTKKFENVIKGDLHYVSSQESLLEDLVRTRPKFTGFSIDAQVRMSTDNQGNEVVESMTKLRSCDLVVEAAMVDGLFESHNEHKNEFDVDESGREFLGEKSKIEIEEIKKSADDFIEKIKN